MLYLNDQLQDDKLKTGTYGNSGSFGAPNPMNHFADDEDDLF